jgi:hypothetical protein
VTELARSELRELSAFSIDSLGFVGDIGLCVSDVPMSLLAFSGRLKYLR